MADELAARSQVLWWRPWRRANGLRQLSARLGQGGVWIVDRQGVAAIGGHYEQVLQQRLRDDRVTQRPVNITDPPF